MTPFETAVFDHRRRCWANGYRPLEVWSPDQRVTDKGEPLNSPGKQPRGRWREAAARTPPEAVQHPPDPRALNTGLLCVKVVAFDVDVLNQKVVDDIVHRIETRLGTTPLVRIGRAPKTLLVYRTETAFRKIQTPELFLPDGTKAKVEILAEGQQFVCDGIHPDTGQAYVWTDGSPETVPLDELPVVTEAEAREIVAAAEQLLREAGGKEKENPQREQAKSEGGRSYTNGSGGDFFEQVKRAALADISAWARGLFPGARFEPGTGAWRVSSKDLGRDRQEDLSIHPDGIRDFGDEVPLTPIDLMLRYGGAGSPLEATLWLCDRLRIDPATLGYIPGQRRAESERSHEFESWAEPYDDEEPWPVLDPVALIGLPGDVVAAIEPHTEADHVAILLQYLVSVGNCIGRGPYYQVEADRHYPKLFAALAGDTAKARKGTSYGRVREIMEIADPTIVRRTHEGGLSSGEGIIWAVRDEIHKREKTGGGKIKIEYVDVVADPGVNDKRLMIVEPEFAGALQVMKREGSTLSRVVRNSWDRGDLATLTKNSPTKATGTHISIITHISNEELRRLMDHTSMVNGYANRFLFACVKRSQALPFGGDVPRDVIDQLGVLTRDAIGFAEVQGRIKFTYDAAGYWEQIYGDLSAAQPGLAGAIVARAEAQTVRLALIYALLDKSPAIDTHHLHAGLALWRYCEASVRYIFGDLLGDPIADDILRALRNAPDGMSRWDISHLFSRNQSSERIGAALALLLKHGKITRTIRPSNGGRPAEIWKAVIK